jgi:hypothetical protein
LKLVRLLLLLVAAPVLHASTVSAAEAGHELGRIKAKPLQEVSGIAASRHYSQVLWMHNDGEARHIYAVKTSGKVASQVKITETVEDVEDVAIGPGPDKDVDYLYLGDIGDNEGDRREVQVVRFPEPAVDEGRGQPKMVGAVVIRLRYPDGPHDAEALMIDSGTGDLILATKEEEKTRIYAARGADLESAGGASLTLEQVAKVDIGPVSGGDISRDGRRLVVRSEDRGWLWERQPEESLRETLRRPPQEIPVRGRRQGQNGEAIAFDPAGQSYWTVSEGKDERIYSFDLPGMTAGQIR